MIATADMLAAALLAAAAWSVLCRIYHMKIGVTRIAVVLQHAALGLGLFGALVLPPPWAKVALSAGVAVFLLASSGRWRRGAPADTEKPVRPPHVMCVAAMPLDEADMRRVAGGSDKP